MFVDFASYDRAAANDPDGTALMALMIRKAGNGGHGLAWCGMEGDGMESAVIQSLMIPREVSYT